MDNSKIAYDEWRQRTFHKQLTLRLQSRITRHQSYLLYRHIHSRLLVQCLVYVAKPATT